MSRRAARRFGRLVSAIVLAAALLRCPADVLILNSGARYEGEVTESGDSYVLVRPDGSRMTFPKRMIRKLVRGPVAAASAPAKKRTPRGRPGSPKALLEALQRRVQSARKKVDVAIEAARQRHRRYGQEIRRATPGMYRDAKARAKAIRDAAQVVRRTRIQRVRIRSRSGGEEIVTKDNARALLAEAQLVLGILEGKRVPPEVAELHKQELDAYAAVAAMAEATLASLAKAPAQMQALADEPQRLKAEMAKWTRQVGLLEKQTNEALAGVRARYDPRRKHPTWDQPEEPPAVRPMGFFTAEQLSGLKAPDEGQRYVVVVVSVPHARVVPSLPAYVEMQQQRFRRAERRLPGRLRVSLHDPKRFGLIVGDGRRVAAAAVADWRKPDAQAEFHRRRAAFTHPPRPPASETVAVCFPASEKQASGEFKLQFAEDEPLAVPAKRLAP